MADKPVRLGYEDIPVLRTRNSAKPTPYNEFVIDIGAAMGVVQKRDDSAVPAPTPSKNKREPVGQP